MMFDVSHRTHYVYSQPVVQSQHLIHMSPRPCLRQVVRHHSLIVDPAPALRQDGIDAFGNERYWLTASYEPGYRHYTATENDLYSDFAVNRVSVMGSLAFARDFSVNLFLNHEPEIHSRREDDFSITLVSLDLTWRF